MRRALWIVLGVSVSRAGVAAFAPSPQWSVSALVPILLGVAGGLATFVVPFLTLLFVRHWYDPRSRRALLALPSLGIAGILLANLWPRLDPGMGIVVLAAGVATLTATLLKVGVLWRFDQHPRW